MDLDAIVSGLARRPLNVALAHSLRLPQRFRMGEWDVHDALEIAFHRTGSGVIEFDGGGTESFAAGTIEIYGPRLGHKLAMDAESPGGHEEFIRVDRIPEFDALVGSSLVLAQPPDAVVAREFATLTRQLPSPTRIERMERNHRATALLLRLLGRAQVRIHGRPPAAADPYALQARTYIRAHARTLRRIEEVALALGIGQARLRRALRTAYGTSPVRELLEARIDLVEEQVRTTRDPLAAIARRCGLDNAVYLCRVFRRLRGTSPGSLRDGQRRKVP